MPDLNRRISDLSQLHPVVRPKVQAIQSQLDAEGIALRVFESFRTPHRQAKLYAQGRTIPGSIVTRAEPWRSYHQYGCAVDFVFFENGEWHWGKNRQHRREYARMHEIARRHGLEPLSWETPHVQLVGSTTANLAAGRYPLGGDDTWADSLNAQIDSWNGSPEAPPRAAVIDVERPPLDAVVVPDDGNGSAPPEGTAQTKRAIPQPESFNLRSRLFAGNAALEAVLDGHCVLRASGQHVAGVDLVQDALNRLALAGAPEYRIETGSFRGFFGQRTERAVAAFQEDLRLRIDGVIGQETIKALDDAIVRLEQGQSIEFVGSAAPATIGANGYAPPVASAALLAGVDFAASDAATGRHLRHAYTQADLTRFQGDPSKCKALLKFPSGAIYFDAKMAICADGSPRAVEIDPPFGLTRTAYKYPTSGGGNFDAEEAPYIVLPGKSEDGRFDFISTFGIRKLDCGVVIHRGRVTPAFYGEVGPVFRLGEVSIALHEQLPVPKPWTSDEKKKVRNSSVAGDVLYLLFPGTAVSGAGKTPAAWLQDTLDQAMQHFETFVASKGARH